MRKQAIKTKYISGRYVWQRPNQPEQDRAKGEWKASVTLTKPDVTINPKIDGFRRPSNYFTKLELDKRDANSVLLPGACSFFPDGPVVPADDPRLGHYGFRGEANIFVRDSDWTFPTSGRPDTLRMKIRNNVRDEILDVAMVLAEIGETARTGAALMHRIGRSMLALRAKDRRSFEYLWDGRPPRDGSGRVLRGRSLDRFNRQTASSYLEWKYGIMPTVYDLQGVTESLDSSTSGSLFNNPPLAVGRAVESYSVNRNMPLGCYEPGGTVASSSVPIIDRVTHKARIDYRIDAEGMRGLNRYGLGLTTLPTILYERTPFSFVFNMVCPIAEIIKAWGALAGSTTVGYCETLHIERTFGQPQVVPSGRYPKDIQVIPRIDEFPCFYFERKAFATPPLPMPYLRNPVKVGNMASVLALFTQMRPKKG